MAGMYTTVREAKTSEALFRMLHCRAMNKFWCTHANA